MPKVSIGLPVYNGAQYLARTLDSLLSQTFRDFELIICDNASEDETETISREYAAKDPRVRYVRNPRNIGGNRNYARVFELSRGEYFRWAACDDLCEPSLIERCVQVLDSRPDVVLAYPKTTLIGANGELLSEYEDRVHLDIASPSERFRAITHNLRLCNSVFGLIRRSALERTRLIRNFVGADTPFLFEMSLHGRFFEIPERLFMRRIHSGAFSSADAAKAEEWCRPEARRRLSFLQWRHSWEYFSIALRAPLDFRERLRVLAYVCRMIVWKREKLVSELRGAVSQIRGGDVTAG